MIVAPDNAPPLLRASAAQGSTSAAPQPAPWLTAAEAADHLRLSSVNALYQRVARGQLKPFRLGRQMRFRRRDLDALMAS